MNSSKVERQIRDFVCKTLIKTKALLFSRSSGIKPPFQQKVFKYFNKLIRWSMGEEEYSSSIARGIEKIKAECIEIQEKNRNNSSEI